MKFLYRYGFLLFTILLTLVGLSVLTSSVENGRDSANEFLSVSMGGSMNSDDYRIIMDGYILSNIAFGGIMFLVGLTFFCISAYKISKKIQRNQLSK